MGSRAIHDKMMWTHVFPLYVVWRCYKKGRGELGILTSCMTILSYAYHHQRESHPLINFAENNFARMFAVYSLIHALKCKHPTMKRVELTLLLLGFAVWRTVGFGTLDYEKWHFLNHLWPVTWLLLYAENHGDLSKDFTIR